MNPFTEEYLKNYEAQIRKLPLDELYEVMSIIKKDSTPERQNIVKARIEELEAEYEKDYRRRVYSEKEHQASWFNDLCSDITEKSDDKPQPLPDREGLTSFILFNGLGFGVLAAALIFGTGMGNARSGSGRGFRELALSDVLLFAHLVPIGVIIFFYCVSSPADKLCNYWIRHHKLALGISSVLSIHSIAAFITGKYSGLLYSSEGAPVYPLAGTILIFSLIFMANAFFPLSRKYRPHNGLTLLALAAALELTARFVF